MLTKEQIESLFDFCRVNGVKPYDVRVELVDHLANAIEEGMAKHPDWSFQQALDVAFASFGPQKFAPLLLEKRKAARLFCWRLFWAVFAEQAERPVTWLGLVVFLYFYHALALFSRQPYVFPFVDCIAGVAANIGICVADWRVEMVQQRMRKRFLLINMKRVRPLVSYGGMFIFALHLIVSQISTGFFASGRLAETALSYQLFFGVSFYIYFLIGQAYFRTTVELRAKVKKDFPAAIL